MTLYILEWYSTRLKMWTLSMLHEDQKAIDDAFNLGAERMPNVVWRVSKRTTELLYTSDDVKK